MRIKYYPILILLFLFAFYCNSPDNSNVSSETNQTDSEASIINKKKVASLDDYDLLNSDFKSYLRSKYSDLKNVLDNDNLTSRLFDSFIEHSVILRSSINENITITDKEISEYSGKNDIHLNESTKNSISDLLRIEKYLFRKIYRNVNVSKYEIQKYYNLNRKEFSQKQRIELFQILLKSRDEAIKVRGELLNNPSRFESIARSRSVSQESVKDGFMGVFEKGDLPKEMESVVSSLSVNQISRVVESQFGFHIFKVSKRQRGKQKYLKTVSEDIEKIIFNKKMISEFTRYMKIIRNSIKIEIYYENLFFSYSDLKGE
ncbi:MAG: peptidyl-prolyl cis-trans isomerase [Candidatus Aminicenantes bacterium]|nr:peptidyl-prolyl cis-trans isomerase [Candidatus Aminicenantes bacterium]MCK5003701.1 peptidyl-prolyl cis-trans isomerase [Candidatus Aminicenantes bacterium]